MIRTFQVDEGAAGERLDVFLATALKVTRSQATKLLKTGSVTVNNQPERPSYLMQADDRLEVQLPNHTPPAAIPPQLPIIYEDNDLLVIDKPAGITMHPGSGTAGQATVADFARGHSSDPDPERPGIVHRLDRDTSGLVVLAKTSAAKTYLQHQFATRAVHKTYTLLVVGHPHPQNAVIKLPLDRDTANPLRRAVASGGREAVTRYRTLGTYPGYSLLEAEPETGRTHQIRVHLASLGHPLAGDTTYGPPKRPLGLTRQFLHAAKLTLIAPSGQPLHLESVLPPDLQQTLRTLEARV